MPPYGQLARPDFRSRYCRASCRHLPHYWRTGAPAAAACLRLAWFPRRYDRRSCRSCPIPNGLAAQPSEVPDLPADHATSRQRRQRGRPSEGRQCRRSRAVSAPRLPAWAGGRRDVASPAAILQWRHQDFLAAGLPHSAPVPPAAFPVLAQRRHPPLASRAALAEAAPARPRAGQALSWQVEKGASRSVPAAAAMPVAAAAAASSMPVRGTVAQVTLEEVKPEEVIRARAVRATPRAVRAVAGPARSPPERGPPSWRAAEAPRPKPEVPPFARRSAARRTRLRALLRPGPGRRFRAPHRLPAQAAADCAIGREAPCGPGHRWPGAPPGSDRGDWRQPWREADNIQP